MSGFSYHHAMALLQHPIRDVTLGRGGSRRAVPSKGFGGRDSVELLKQKERMRSTGIAGAGSLARLGKALNSWNYRTLARVRPLHGTGKSHLAS